MPLGRVIYKVNLMLCLEQLMTCTIGFSERPTLEAEQDRSYAGLGVLFCWQLFSIEMDLSSRDATTDTAART